MDETRATQATGTLSAALDHAAAILGEHPELAEAQAHAILAALPGQQQALFLLVSVHRASGDLDGARKLLESLCRQSPGLSALQYELGLVLAALDDQTGAIDALSRAVALEPEHLAAWRALGISRASSGDRTGAAAAFARYMKGGAKELKLLEDAGDAAVDQLAIGETMLRQFLGVHPTDACMLHMLARIVMRLRRYADAETILLRALELAPDFDAARPDLALALHHQMKWRESNRQIDIILARDPQNAAVQALQSTNRTMAEASPPRPRSPA